MATVELIPPPEPEKQVVIRLTAAEARILRDRCAPAPYSITLESIVGGINAVLG